MRFAVLGVVAATALSLVGILARAGEKHVITQKGKAFSASELTVKVGEVVAFKNDDDVAHNVFSVSKVQPFNLKMQQPGTENQVSFTSEGTIEVRCAIHPQMKLTVHVSK